MDRKSYKNVIEFRLCNTKTGEIEYELIKQYDLYYLFDKNFLHQKLDDFLQKVVKLGGVGTYSIEFQNRVRQSDVELELPF